MTQSLRLVIITTLLLYTAYTAQCMNDIDTADRKIAYYRASLSRNRNIVQFIDQTLQSYGLPKALHNLALIESDFNNKILSAANAAGTWQITPGTASDYGLRMDSINDERYDLYKSTQAACRNLADLYRQYRNWIQVVAAYNCGAGRVNNAIAEAGSNNYADFCRYLPTETVKHVYKFQLACRANGDTIESAIAEKTNTTPPGTTSVPIGAGYKLSVIAAKLRLPVEQLQNLNPAFDKADYAGAFVLYLPTDSMPDFILMQNEVLKESLELDN